MTFELDPDLWLAVRMMFGRGWQLGLRLGLFAIGIAAFAWIRDPAVAFGRIAWPMADLLDSLIIFTLMIAPAIPLGVFLLNLERRGLLDCVRLCGRPPHRVLLLLFAGLALPFVLPVLLVTFGHPSVHVTTIVGPGLVLFMAALDVALIVFGTLPAKVDAAAMLTGTTGVFAVAAVSALPYVGRLSARSSTLLQLTIGGLVFAVFPLAARVACRRLGRPGRRATAAKVSRLAPILRRVAPDGSQPEFTRYLRSAVPSAAKAALVMGTIAAGAAGVARYQATSHPVTSGYVGPFVAMSYVWSFGILALGAGRLAEVVRREFEADTIELVRLARQSPEAIGLGWYAGSALPFAAAALPPALVALFVAPAVFPMARPLVAWGLITTASALPAMTLAGCLSSRRTIVHQVVYGTLAIPCFVAIPRGLRTLMLGARGLNAWQVGLIAVMPLLITIIALAVSVGRLRRPQGPALIGVHAAAAVAAIAICARVFPLDIFPRLAIVLLAVAASCVAEDRAVPTPPWRRLAIAGSGAMAGALIATGGAGLGTAAMLTTAAGATLAVGIGLIAYDVRDRPALAFGLPIVIVVASARLPWRALRDAASVRVPLPAIPPLYAGELAVLAATFVVMVIAHARVRAADTVTSR